MIDSLEGFFLDDGKYEAMLRSSSTIIIDHHDLYAYDEELAIALIDDPIQFTEDVRHYMAPPADRPIQFINIIETTPIRNIATKHVGKLIQAEAIVVTASFPESTMIVAAFQCSVCGGKVMVEQNSHKIKTPQKCTNTPCTTRKGFELLVEDSIYIDTRLLRLQERPEELPPGEVPEPLEATLKEGLVREAKPGDRVRVAGVIGLRQITKRRGLDYRRVLDVNSIKAYNRSPINDELTSIQIDEILEISRKPELEQVLINSYATSIYGWNHVKQALLYAQFGGVRKMKGALPTRGDINILMVGDPGTGKSQLLQFTQRAATRGVFSTGGGVSGVGLTAALVKDGDRWVLAAGTMALADMGLALIDEFEKMRDEDRDKIHLAMEQGIIKIDKGDVHATLNSRCGLIGACNPSDGRYNIYKTIPENVDKFPVSLLSRFDLIFIFLDVAKEETDKKMAERILGLKSVEGDKLSLPLLRRYISYSKTINPVIPDEVKYAIHDYYVKKRQDRQEEKGLKITPRQLESLERLTEARARMHLREAVTLEDFDVVKKLFEIFINEACRDHETGMIDVDILLTGRPRSLSEKLSRLLDIIVSMSNSNIEGKWVSDEALREVVKNEWEIKDGEITKLLGLLEQDRRVYKPTFGRWKTT